MHAINIQNESILPSTTRTWSCDQNGRELFVQTIDVSVHLGSTIHDHTGQVTMMRN